MRYFVMYERYFTREQSLKYCCLSLLIISKAIVVSKKNNLESSASPYVRAIVVNSGNANAFTGHLGDETVNIVSNFLSRKLNCKTNEVYTASTGVIGEILNPDLIINGLKKMNAVHETDWLKAADTIRTTDTFSKLLSKKCLIDNVEINIVGIAKGSGMIAPDMATMLGFIFTDANIPSVILQKLLQEANKKSFRMI